MFRLFSPLLMFVAWSACAGTLSWMPIHHFDVDDEGFIPGFMQKPHPAATSDRSTRVIPAKKHLFLVESDGAARGGVLEVQASFARDSLNRARPFVVYPGTNWSLAHTLTYQVYLPESWKGSFRTWFMVETGPGWRRWEHPKPVSLTPGKWNTAAFDIASYADSADWGRVGKLALYVEGRPVNTCAGSFFVDSVGAWCPGSLYPLPEMTECAAHETVSVDVKIDGARYGGVVSRDLFSFNQGATTFDYNDHYQKLLRDCGPGVVRMWGFMPEWNPARGKYDFSEYDRMVEYFLEAGWTPMIVIGRLPEWNAYEYRSGDVIPRGPGAEKNITHQLTGPPLDYAAFAEAYAALVDHLNNKKKYGIRYVEIWNEPDLPFWGGTEEEYIRLVDVTARAIKKVAPSVKIGAGVFSGPTALEHRLERLFDGIDTRTIDFVSHHRYFNATPRTTTEDMVSMVPMFERGPHITRTLCREYEQRTGKPTGHIQVLMTEASVSPSLEYMPRIETVWYTVFWARALHYLILQNTQVATYFTFAGHLWGAVDRTPRQVYHLVKMLNGEVGLTGGRWLKCEYDQQSLTVLATRELDSTGTAERVAILITNGNVHNQAYALQMKLDNLNLSSPMRALRLAHGDTEPVSLPRVEVDSGTLHLVVPPMSVVALVGHGNDTAGFGAMRKWERPGSAAALGMAVNGQYSFQASPLGIAPADGPVVIDGRLGEYRRASALRIDRAANIVGDTSRWHGADDLSARIRCLYDTSGLYFACDITDDSVVTNANDDPAEAWKDDAVELYLSTHEIYVGRSTKSPYDYQLIFSFRNGGEGEAQAYSFPGPGRGVRGQFIPGSRVSGRLSKEGYRLEAFVPVNAFQDMPALKPGMRLRMDFGLCDVDRNDGVGRETHMFWNSTVESWDSPDQWGLAELR